MSLLGLVKLPAATVSPQTPVLEAIRLMEQRGVGSVPVLEKDKLCGIFSARDFVGRVATKGLDPERTSVSDVMTSQVETLSHDTSCGAALQLMIERNCCHVPIIDEENRFRGMLSIHDLLERRVEQLSYELDSLANYVSVDETGD
jgi:CBS domain-containing protein